MLIFPSEIKNYKMLIKNQEIILKNNHMIKIQ